MRPKANESADPARRGGRSLRESCFLCSSSGIGGEGLEGKVGSKGAPKMDEFFDTCAAFHSSGC